MGWRRVLYLLSLAGCIAFYILYRMWLSGLVLAAILALPWFSLLFSLPALCTTRLALEHPQYAELGQPIPAGLTGRCPLPTPVFRGWLRVRNVMTGEEWDLKPGEPLPTSHCGQLTIRLRSCRIYDYLGLFRFPMGKKPQGTMLVRPTAAAPAEMPDLSRAIARAWRPKRGGGFGENHELRLYRPGDSLQQIHWKLTAKTGKLILRETVEPERGKLLVRMDLSGTDDTLDRKLGQALWLGRYLLENELPHELRVLTGAGPRSFPIDSEATLRQAVDTLLACPCAQAPSAPAPDPTASWEYYIGGDGHEA